MARVREPRRVGEGAEIAHTAQRAFNEGHHELAFTGYLMAVRREIDIDLAGAYLKRAETIARVYLRDERPVVREVSGTSVSLSQSETYVKFARMIVDPRNNLETELRRVESDEVEKIRTAAVGNTNIEDLQNRKIYSSRVYMDEEYGAFVRDCVERIEAKMASYKFSEAENIMDGLVEYLARDGGYTGTRVLFKIFAEMEDEMAAAMIRGGAPKMGVRHKETANEYRELYSGKRGAD